MELICFIGGSVVGAIITYLFNERAKTYGVIEVDHVRECCNINLTTNELLNRKRKKVIFDINHEANLSRKEQGL